MITIPRLSTQAAFAAALATLVQLAEPVGASDRATDRLSMPVPDFSLFTRTANFGEGLVFDRDGRLFLSDAFNNQVLSVDRSGEVTVWSDVVQMPNGHKILPGGTHIVMEGGVWPETTPQGAIVHLDADGNLIQRITHDDQGNRLRWPNDIAIDLGSGGFYFTDPGRFMGNEPGRIYYVDRQMNVQTLSDGSVDFPNGIVLSADGARLFVAESLQNRVLTFDVDGPGKVSNPQVFATLPSVPNHWTSGEAEPDGIALDDDGRLYVAHFGAGLVHVFSPEGELLGSLASGSGTVTNLAFDPTSPSDLYIYAATGLSFDQIGEGGEIIKMTLEGVSGLRLID